MPFKPNSCNRTLDLAAKTPHPNRRLDMGTAVVWEGNISSAPKYKRFQKVNQDPRQLLRLNVDFNNNIRRRDNSYEDRSDFWAHVELWHREAKSDSRVY
ncbi:hypothetical protein [Pseudomonas flavocrustae]|uniref:hypothetical protein n=1 Tax=Pseudomonas flavocrustae TaxID=2991719 RepID=UPI003D6715A2